MEQYDFVIDASTDDGFHFFGSPPQQPSWLFKPGPLVMTNGVYSLIGDDVPNDLIVPQLMRFFVSHMRGNWGSCDLHDRHVNEHALKTGARVMSTWQLDDNTRIWIITDGVIDNEAPMPNRYRTTFLLPEEY